MVLLPNTHPDFRPSTTRAFYDMKFQEWKKRLNDHGFNRMTSFALVDPAKDKTHTGEYIVKLQALTPKNEDDTDPQFKYTYVVAKMNHDGQMTHNPIVWQSNDDTMLCVCESDLYSDRVVPTYDYDNLQPSDYWHPDELDEDGNPKGIRDIPMVHSTTSAHYSVFIQQIPEEDLDDVRNYFQFKTRLEGMEICLVDLQRNVYRKEVSASECFIQQTFALERLFNEFAKNKELMQLVVRYYDLVYEWDELVVKRYQLNGVKDDKLELLEQLTREYNAIPYNQLDKKMELGNKIQSLKLELDKNLNVAIESIDERKTRINIEIGEINDRIRELNKDAEPVSEEFVESAFSTLVGMMEDTSETPDLKPDDPPQTMGDIHSRLQEKIQKAKERLGFENSESHLVWLDQDVMDKITQQAQSDISNLEHALVDSATGSLWESYKEHFSTNSHWTR